MVTKEDVNKAIKKFDDSRSKRSPNFTLEVRNRSLYDSIRKARENFQCTLYKCDSIVNDVHKEGQVNRVLNQGMLALKRLDKLANYANDNYYSLSNDKKNDIFKELDAWVSLLNEDKYEQIISAYDVKFDVIDREKAAKNFKRDPSEKFLGRKQGLMYSYIVNENGELTRRENELGSGGFGRTKEGTSAQSNKPLAIKRQTNNPMYPNWLENVRKEAKINFDLGVATSSLIERKDGSGKVYKVYQEMNNLGSPLNDVIKEKSLSEDKQLDYSIELLLNMRDLHSGKASKSGKKYAHLDIKPQNILVDNSGKLHFIDFGFAKDKGLSATHFANCGSKYYLPIPVNSQLDVQGNITQVNNRAILFRLVNETPSYFFDDQIAVLRTIYHPLLPNEGIIRQDYFNRLPEHVSNILDTRNISDCISNKLTATSIASVLILYKSNDKCTKEEVNTLLLSPKDQIKLIVNYKNKSSGLSNLSDDHLDIIAKLTLYKEKIETNSFKNKTNFEHGFKGLFKKSQGLGREVNYTLASKLIDELSRHDSDPAKVMSKVSEYKKQIQQLKGTYRLSFGPTTSNELNSIINESLKLKK